MPRKVKEQKCTCGSGTYCHVHLQYGFLVRDLRFQTPKDPHIEDNYIYQPCNGGRRVLRKIRLSD